MVIGSGTRDGLGTVNVTAGAGAGLVGAVIVGVVIQAGIDPRVLSTGIPGGVGLSGLLAGWAVFLVMGAVLGAVYGALTRIRPLGELADRPGPGAWLGLGYGLVLWGLAVVVVPLWVGAGPSGIGTYAVSVRGALAFGLLGTIIGLGYAISPTTR